MISICLYFQAHQPYRIRELSFFEIGDKPKIFDIALNKKILSRVTKSSYLPSFELFRQLNKKTGGEFHFALSITGVLLEQWAKSQPDCIEAVGELAGSGCTELLGETYYHSFASLYSYSEFEEQVTMHKNALQSHFNYEPKIFRNTELAFRSDMVGSLEKLGYHAIFIEGSDRTLKGKNENFLYNSSRTRGIKIFTRSQEYSNIFALPGLEIGKKNKFPKPGDIIDKISQDTGDIINIWFDIECLGEHIKKSSGIFKFFEDFILKALDSGHIKFILPSEAESTLKTRGTIEVFSPVTWHVRYNDISAWNGNAMQIEAMKYIYGIEKKLKATGNPRIIDDWRKIQSSDHLLYMDTEENEQGRPAQQFSPFKSPHQAYIYLMNALASLEVEAEQL